MVVGLGNPGLRYQNTRHNVGFLVVEAFARACQIGFREKSEVYQMGSGRIDHQDILIAKPRTFMNQSGTAVKQLLEKTGVDPSHLMVVHDEIDLALGRIQVKAKGGHGGHRGILSIISALKTDQFYRLRVGVGRPPEGQDPAEYVLHPFRSEDHSLLDEVVQRSVEAIRCFLLEGPQKAMNRYNVKEKERR